MIKGILGTTHIQVESNPTTTLYVDMSRTLAGTVRYNGNNKELEVYDGYTWLAITNNYATISLDNLSKTAIDWVVKKMTQETNRRELAQKYPAVRIALENLDRAEEQLETTIYLTTNYETQTSN